ncbi:MAG: hypothetical protein ACI39C_07310 [Dietzia sp.]
MTAPERPAAGGVFVVRDPDLCDAIAVMLEPHRTTPAPQPAARGVDGSDRAAALMAAAQAHARGITTEYEGTLATDATIEQILGYVYVAGLSQGQEKGADDALSQLREATERNRRLESDLAQAVRAQEKTYEQLRDALAKIADLEANPPEPAEPDADLTARIVELETEVATAGRDLELAEGEVRKLRETVAGLHADLDKARKAPPAAPAPRATGSRIADKRAFSDLADRIDNQARGQSKDLSTGMRLAARGLREEIAAVYGPAGKKAS